MIKRLVVALLLSCSAPVWAHHHHHHTHHTHDQAIRHERRVARHHHAHPRRLAIKESASGPLRLASGAALIMDADNNQVLYAKNPDAQMPIASISKLMTAMVVLDSHPDMNEPITITEDDVDTLRHSMSRLPVGTTLPRRQMLLLALMASENRAAHALARTYPGGLEKAVSAMNAKALSLGMEHTHFIDPTGLHAENQSTPNDLARMVKAAQRYATIHEDTTTAGGSFSVGVRHYEQAFHNTDPLVRSHRWDIDLSKTGFINEAGKCLVLEARITDRHIIMVLMHSWGSYTRFGDANRVRAWIDAHYRERVASVN